MNFLRKPWVSAILAILAAIVVYYQFAPAHWRLPGSAPALKPAPPPAQTASPKPPEPLLTNAATPDSPEAGIDRAYADSRFAAWVNSPQRDPFLLLAPPTDLSAASAETNSPLRHWKLKAIWEQTGSRLVVINRGVYAEGDEIEGYKILKITSAEVWFQGPDGKERLGFDTRPPGSKVPPANQPPPRPKGT